MKSLILLLGLGAVFLVVPKDVQSAAAQPFVPAGPAVIQKEQAQSQQQQPAPYVTKQPGQQMQQMQQSAPAQAQKAQPAVPFSKQGTELQQKPSQKGTEEAKLVSVKAEPPQWISWGFLRVNQPETVERMLGDVNAGRLARNAVDGVVHPSQLDPLLKKTGQAATGVAVAKRLPTDAVTQKGSSQAASSTPRPDVSGAAKAPPSSGVAFVPALRSLPLRTTPDQIEFGSMMVGQNQTRTVRFVSPVNGEVRVSIGDPAFRIRRLRSLNGEFVMQTAPVALAGGATIQTANPVPNTSQVRTAPPWAIQVKSGEDVEVTIDVSRSPSVTLGEHASQLRIDLTNSLGAIVPVHARLDGRLYGIGINVDDSLRLLLGSDFMLPFEWVNDGEPGDATLTLDNPPLGFTTPTPTQTVKLGKGERRQGAFVVNASNVLIPTDSNIAHRAVLNLKLVNGPVWSIYAVNVIGYRPWLMSAVRGTLRFSDGDAVEVYGGMQIRSDGWFQFAGKITASGTSPLIQTRIYRYDVGISFPGGFNHTVHGSFGKGTIGRSATTEDRWSESGMNIHLANSFVAAASGIGQAVANPYMKVTRSTF